MNVHLYPSDFTSESRILKITEAITTEGIFDHVLMLGTWRGGLPRTQEVDARSEIRRLGRSKMGGHLLRKVCGTLDWYRAVWRELRGQRVDCLNCHSLPILPLCIALKWRHRSILVYDTHELETETAGSTRVRKTIMKLLERACIRFVDSTFVVGDRIGRWYRETYKIDPVVIKNMPRRVAIGTKPSDLRARCGIPQEAVVFIYLGIVAPARGIKRTIELFEECPQFHVIFMGDGPLSKEVACAHERHPNIHYVPAVHPADVAAVARGADVGILLQPITCLSYAYTSPNKFFEYLQAGLPVMVPDDAVELRELVELHGIGWAVPQNQSEILTRLRGIDRGAIEQARRSVLRIQPQMHWDVERAKLVDAYRAIVGRALTKKSRDA
jgi:hypothetical protein